MAEPLLTLDTLEPKDRPFLTIDGKPYSYRLPSEFGLIEQAKIARLTEEVDTIVKKGEEATDADVGVLDKAVTSFCLLILEAPADLIEALTFTQRFQILRTYRQVRRSFSKATPNRETRRRSRSTSGRSSRPSPASTAPTTG